MGILPQMRGRGLYYLPLLILTGCGEVEPVPYRTDPVMAVVDPVAAYLLEARWPCAGDGCADVEAVGRLANSIRIQSARLELPVSLMVGVLMVENPWLDTLAVSPAGARGLYQTMPVHRDAWPECPGEQVSIRGSVCRGAEIMADFLTRHDLTDALLRYNGCRQRRCAGYPGKVMAEADSFAGG